jgi:RNA chaperone Hfq
VQDEFWNTYIKEKTLALFSFNSGDEIRGVVEGYDGFTISIRTSRGQVLLYKHGVCSIGPGYRRHSGKEDAR